MKLLFLLILMVPIVSFLRFILLDILDELIAPKTSYKKTKQVEIFSNETYSYKKAQ